jgi:hypothetical protein
VAARHFGAPDNRLDLDGGFQLGEHRPLLSNRG